MWFILSHFTTFFHFSRAYPHFTCHIRFLSNSLLTDHKDTLWLLHTSHTYEISNMTIFIVRSKTFLDVYNEDKKRKFHVIWRKEEKWNLSFKREKFHKKKIYKNEWYYIHNKWNTVLCQKWENRIFFYNTIAALVKLCGECRTNGEGFHYVCTSDTLNIDDYTYTQTHMTQIYIVRPGFSGGSSTSLFVIMRIHMHAVTER